MAKQLMLEDHIRRNKRLTVIICTFMALLFCIVIFAFGYIFTGNIYLGLVFGIPIAIVYIAITYSFSVQTVLSAAKARPAKPQVREEKLFIYKVEEMAIAAGLPTPKAYVQAFINLDKGINQLGYFAKYIFDVVEEREFSGTVSKKQFEEFALGRSIIEDAIEMLKVFKVAGDSVTMVPIMRNLWGFDWKCYHCGWKKYQGPTPEKCEDCGKGDKIRKKMIWIGKRNPQSTSYCFDPSPKFQYFEDWKHRPAYKKDKKDKGLTETMSLQGSCWMITQKKYWELKVIS